MATTFVHTNAQTLRRVAGIGALVVLSAACGSTKTTVASAPLTKPTSPNVTVTTAMDPGMDHSASKAKDPATGTHDAGTGTATGQDASTATGHHQHNDSKITYAELSPQTKAQVDVVIKWSQKYKTAADAKKDGWVKATRSLYGIGSHWLKGGVVGFATAAGQVDITQPNVLLFEGEGDDAKLAGVSWIIASSTDPEGFKGPDDHWHRHDSVCFAGGLVISEGNAEGSPINLSPEGCKKKQGIMFPIANLTMMHLWIGDGYMGNYALFAHDHPKLLNGYQPSKDA